MKKINLKRISIGTLTGVALISPIIAVSCNENTIEKEQTAKEKLLEKFKQNIKQDKAITIKIDESKFNGDIKDNKQLIRYMLIPEYFTKKKTFLNPIIKNKEVLPRMVEYNSWSSAMSKILDDFSKTEDVKGMISSTQIHLKEASKKILDIADELFSLKEVTIQDSKGNSETYNIDAKMITHAEEVLANTWTIFKLVTSKYVQKLIDKIDTETTEGFLASYHKMVKDPFIKKMMEIIRKRTFVLNEINSNINKLIYVKIKK